MEKLHGEKTGNEALKKLDIYIIKKFLGTFFFSLMLIICITVVFDASEKLEDFMGKHAPLKAILFDYYLNFIPYFVNLFSSLFTFIAVIFFTSRMASSMEIVAILSNGISFRRMLFPYFISALVIALLSLYMLNFVIPDSNKKRLTFEYKYIRNPYKNFDVDIHRQIKPGIYIYMESYDNNYKTGYKFSLEKFDKGRLVSKLLADIVMWDTSLNKWAVKNYYIREIGDSLEKLTRGAHLDTAIAMLPADFERRDEDIEKMNYFELNDFIDEMKLQGSEKIEPYLVQKYQRFALPFSTFILALIGVSLAARKMKGGIGLHIGIGLFLSFSYIFFMQISNMFAISGNVPPIVAVWIPNLMYAVIAVVLYKLAPK